MSARSRPNGAVGDEKVNARITRRLPTIGWAAVLAAFAGVPVVFHRSTADVFNVVKITWLWLAVIVAVACWIGSSAARRRWVPLPWVAVPTGVLLVLTVLATAVSVSPAVSLVGQYRRYDGLASSIACVALALVVVAYTWERPARLRQLLVAGVAGGAVAAGYVLAQEAGLDPWTWLDSRGRVPSDPIGPLGNPNFAGAYLALCVPLVLGWRVTVDDRRVRWALHGLAGVLALGVWFAQSRGGFLALVVGVAVCGVFDRGAVPRLVTGAAALASVAGIVLVLTFVVAGSVPVPGGSDGEASVTDTSTLESRARLWRGAVGVIAAHPFIGTGPDTFLVAYPPHRPFDDGASIELAADEPHNILLDRAAGSGLPALVAYLGVLGVTFILAWRHRREPHDDRRPLVAAFAGLLAAYLAQGLVSLDVPPLALAGWLAVGALAAATDPRVEAARMATGEGEGRPRRPANADERPIRPLPTIALLALGGGSVALGLGALRPLIADVRYRDGVEASNRDAPVAEVAAAFDSAIAWNPAEPAYEVRRAQHWQQLAERDGVDGAEKRNLYRAGWPHFDRALRLQPGNPFTLREAARYQRAWALVDDKQFDDAEALYDEALVIDPYNWQIRSDYAALLEAWARSAVDPARRDQAIDQLEQVVDLRPIYTDGWLQLGILYEATGRIDDATAAFEQAFRLDPSSTRVTQVVDAFVEAHPDVDLAAE